MVATDDYPTPAELADLTARLMEAAERWERLGRLQLARSNDDGHDDLRLARRLRALANVSRSRVGATLINAKVLRQHAKGRTVPLADAIIGSLPGGKIPGYVERA